MKILFTHAYFLSEDPKEQAINKPYPPLGILYLSAWLDQHGYPNSVFDTTFATPLAQQQQLLHQRPDILAVYTNLMTKLHVVKLLQFIRQEESLRQCLIVVGGPDITYNIDQYLKLGADVLVIGEGEQTLLEIVKACEEGLRPQFGHIEGLAYRDAEGRTICTAKRQHLKKVDELPFPNRHKINLQQYLDLWKHHHGRSSVSVSTQRGCPYTCRWCSTAVYGQSYRRRSPGSVVAELKWIQQQYQPDQIWFVDDVFTVSHKWLAGFVQALQKEGVRIPFECITRADRMNEEVIAMLKSAGCFRVWIGAESGSQRILDAMDRRVETQKVQQMIVHCREQGIETGTFVMLGYPGETEADIRQTLYHLQRANPDWFTITIAYPIKGTGLYEEVFGQRLKELDWQRTTDRDIDFVRTYARPYYDLAVRWVVNGLHWHKLRSTQTRPSAASSIYWMKMKLAALGMWWYRNFGKKQKAIEISNPISAAPKGVLSDS